MTAVVFFQSDSDSLTFKQLGYAAIVTKQFTQRLSKSMYPASAAPQVTVRFFSHEDIMKTGGYAHFLKTYDLSKD